jgi:curved DNA-binding protein CbpA
MHRDPLQRLVHFVATEANPHHLILRVVSDSSLLRQAQRLGREIPGAETAAYRRVADLCRANKVLPEYFLERLQLVARILHLIPCDQNYYETLAVSRSAGHEEIKQAFRRLSFASHPDTNPNDPDAAARFRNLQHAHEVLSNDELRRRYDRNLEACSWADVEIPPEEGPPAPVGWSKWRRAWPVGALLAILVLLSSTIDYRQWQTERYFAHTDQPASMRPPLEGREPNRASRSLPSLDGRGRGRVKPTEAQQPHPTSPIEGEEASAEVPAPAAPAPGSAAQSQDVDREVRTFLSRFTSAYEARDPGALLRFFEADAIENGTPVENLMPVYEANFQRVEKLRYRINVGRWEMGEDEVMVDGSFNLTVQFWQEAPVESMGPIHLTLTRRDGDFTVKQLTYSFKESRKITE